MKTVGIAAAALAVAAIHATAQVPDSTRARQDSIALVRELERMQRDTATKPPTQQGPTNPRLLPDISAVGDFVADLSPKGSTQEMLCRLCVREVEVALQAAVDPYFRGDVFIGFSDAEGASIEQAFLTTTSLPYSLEARLGRFLMPFGKINTTHRHDLHTVEYPWVIQRFLGSEGLKGTGVYVSKILSPFGFYQELQVTAVDALGETDEDLQAQDPASKDLGNLGFTARLRNYWDLSQASNLEISLSGATSKRPQPFDFGITPPAAGVNAVNVRQSLVGADVTFRWRPLQQGLYKSLIVQAEYLRQINKGVTATFGSYLGPVGDFDGGYGFARWQLTRRLYVAGRYDWLQDPLTNGETFAAGSGYLEWFPSEFSKLMLAYERGMPAGLEATNRLLLQATFALGPHKPHPF